jgi:multidrug resistance efflux pump
MLITAPFDGIVSDVTVYEGQVIPDMHDTPGHPTTTVVVITHTKVHPAVSTTGSINDAPAKR